MEDGDVTVIEIDEEEAVLRKTAYKTLYERSITLINKPEVDNEALAESEKIQKACTELTKKAEVAHELVVDMKIMMVNSNYLKKHIETSSTNVYTFKASEYADHIVAHMKDRRYLTKSQDYDWSRLAPVAADVFAYKCPMFSPMLGLFDLQDAVAAAPAARRTRKSQEKAKEAKVLSKVANVVTDEDGLDATLKKIRQTLGSVYRQNNNRSIRFMKFVIDPQSFSRSIENIFHVSFLVRDGVVRVDKDDDGEIVISPVPTNLRIDSSDMESRRQFIFNLSMPMWEKDGVQVFGI
ncbi:non-structural maintenance of chromosomes element 4 homolog A-like isoform X2 [Bacillus rossius redtenbacheri]|uniref:non-structural maintenance of chromosomes element 4 homolog A-like isoform X2 n=1 Tax=Bacillus rossius redtenbacheri TaxID=93214 RepID=UPI002FDDA092